MTSDDKKTYRYQITVDGKTHHVNKDNIDKYGWDGYAEDYPDATVRMRDDDGGDYDVPLGRVDAMMEAGLHPFRTVNTSPAPAPAADAGGAQEARPVQEAQRDSGGEPSEAWSPTMQEKAAMTAVAQGAALAGKRTVDDFDTRAGNINEYGRSLAGGRATESDYRLNPGSGRLERTYLTPTGGRTFDKAAADAASRAYRDAVDMTVSGQLRRAVKLRDDISRRLAERGRELQDEYDKKSVFQKMVASMQHAEGGYQGNAAGTTQDDEYTKLMAALRQANETIDELSKQQRREEGNPRGFWESAGRVMADPYTWLSAPAASDAVARVNTRGGAGEADDLLLEASSANEQAQAMYGGNAGFLERAGVMFGHMPSFMTDFMSTGGFGGIKFFTKAAGKAVPKVIGAEAVEQMAEQGIKAYVKRNGARGLVDVAADWTVKALGTTADDLLVRAPLMANTVQAGDTMADIIDRKLGGVEVDEDGNYNYSDDKTWGSAIWQGEANAVVENYSEMFGAHLPELASMKNLGRLANVIGAKRLGGVLAKADAGALGGITESTRRLFGQMGVSDYLGEVSEEYYGQLWRTMLGLDDAYRQNADGTRTNLLATGQFHGDIWGGMALSMGLMGAGKATMSAANYLSLKHDVRKADARAGELLTPEIWEPLRSTIDMTTNDNVGDVAEAIVNDKQLTDDEKAAALDYMERSLYLRGANLAELAKSRGGGQDEDVQRANECYMDGYNAQGGEEMQDVRNMYELQRQKTGQALSPETLAEIDADPIGALHDLGDDTAAGQTAIDYINAKQVYDGMLQRVRDDIDGRIDQSNAMIDRRVNRTTGMIQGAVMKVQDDAGGDRRVYVLGGNIATLPDGTGIDFDNSDGSIIIRDAATGEIEMVSPDAIFSLEQPLDPGTEKLAAAEAIRRQYAAEAAARIDGTVAFNPGDTYTLTNESGQAAQIQVVPNGDGLADNGDGTVNVSPDGGQTIVPMPKEDIQAMVDATNRARAARLEEEREAMRARHPAYSLNEEITLTDENGNAVRGSITAEANEDGQYEVFTEAPINGRSVNLFTAEELDSLRAAGDAGSANQNPELAFQNPESANQNPETPRQNAGAPGQAATGQPPAPGLIPRDAQGQPLYEQADPGAAWDALLEQSGGDESIAQEVANDMVADKEAAVKKLEKQKPKSGTTPAEKIAARLEQNRIVEQAKAELTAWQRIAQTPQRRKQAALAEQSRAASEAARLRREQEEKERAEREAAERIRREALNGVPDFADDTPQDARARGYRRVNGNKVDRQRAIAARMGGEVRVKFDDNNIPTGHVALIDASQLQPSHMGGRRNPLHFIDEAQPKERNDEASVMSARKIAANIRPEEITSSVTAYTGAPTVNTRGEVIQGNNRSAALREMWAEHPGQAARYCQYLTDHATDFGLTPEEVETIGQPVLVNMLDVTDEESIRLGQFVAQDTESGGTERMKPKNIVQKMGDDIRIFANQLLDSPDEEMSFAGLVDRNGISVLKWMQQKGHITPTQYKSAFDSKGNLTAEAKNDLKGVMFQSIFQNGNTRLEEMFGMLPAKAQKAILATAYRDYDSPNAERMNAEIQASIQAYYSLSQYTEFANSKNYKEARIAAEAWKRQFAFDDVTGESYLPSERYSNFALLLAVTYKGQTQGFIQNTLGHIFDLVQGTQEATLFDEPDNTPRTLVKAINEAINVRGDELLLNGKFTYDGQRRSNVLAGGSAASQQGRQGSAGDAPAGGRAEGGARTATYNRGTETRLDARQSGLPQSEAGGRRKAEEHPFPQENTQSGQKGQVSRPTIAPRLMTDSEKEQRGDMLRNAPAIDVEVGQIVSTPELSARKVAERWWDENVPEPVFYDTEVGEVEINRNSVESSLAHRYGQAKLDAITSLVEGFENAVYLGTLPDSRERGVVDHYFAYPINYKGKRNYVFCRAMQDANKNRLYVHEVFVADNIKKGDTLQTAASKPHGGIALYKDILANVLGETSEPTNSRTYVDSNLNGMSDDTATQHSSHVSIRKDTDKSRVTQTIGEKVAKTEEETEQREAELASRVQVNDDDWQDGDGERPTYKRSIIIDGTHTATQIDEPDENGHYTGSYFEFDNKRFGDIAEIVDYIDNGNTLASKIAQAEAETDQNPTEAQKEAGNYKKGHVRIGQFNITVENPKGSVRRGTDANGNRWETTMRNTYGYIRGTEGVDGDHIDVFLTDEIDGWNGRRVYVVDQYNEDGTFDEHKVMLGFNEEYEARDAYFSNYSDDWADKRKIVMTSTNLEDFKKWIDSSHRKTKPFAEYRSVNAEQSKSISPADRIAEIDAQMADLKKQADEAHGRSDLFEEARIISESNELYAERRRLVQEMQPSAVQAEDENAGQTQRPSATDDRYTIERRYHKKNGSYIHAVKFTEQMPREQFLSLKKCVKDFGGYYSSYGKGGFIFETEEAGRKFAEAVLDPSGEKLDDEKPLSLDDMLQINRPAMRQVDVEGLMQAINRDGEAKLSDHFIVGKPGLTERLSGGNTNGQTSNTEAGQANDTYGADNMLVSRARYEELKKRMRQKLGGQMNMGIDPEILAIGTEMAAYHIEAGARRFADYARRMIADLGDAIRPYLKSFYNGARDLPEVQEAGYADEMTPYEDVRAFDVANFDRGSTDAFATAEMVVAEQEVGRQAEKAKSEIINRRNNERRKENEQTAADTEAVAGQAEAVASKAESRIEAATDEKQVNETVEEIDSQLDKVNEQLALLGYYEADQVEDDFNEAYGYMRNAEKKAVKDANRLANRLVKDLGIDPKAIVDKKGKRRRSIAVANIAPIGGDISIYLPLGDKRELYINIQLDKQNGDNLKAKGGYVRIENPNPERGEERYLSSNNFFADDETYQSLLRKVQQLVKHYVTDFVPKSNTQQEVSAKAERKQAKRQRKQEEPKIADLFSAFEEENIAESQANLPFQKGDAVIYHGKPATVYDFDDDGRLVLDTGLAPVLYDIADPKEVKPANTASPNVENAEINRTFANAVKTDMLVALDSGTRPYRSILDLRKRAASLGMEVDNDGRTDILLQELVEDGLVRAAREVVEQHGRDSRESYDLICKLYDMQPTIAARSSNRIKMQQYSTPLPMAWNAAHFAMSGKKDGKVLEPTAGNGMLVFSVPAQQVHANELDETRLDNLREQGFAQVTRHDAAEPFDGGQQYDVIIANPPFGKREEVEYDGKMIPGLDPQITLNALASMKDDGRAAIIIGGNMEYAGNGGLKSMKPFFTYLYDHYNVKGVVDMDGSLYAKQGTTYPTRMILIDGRRSDEERARSAVYPPVQSKAIRKADSFEALYDIIDELTNSKDKTNGTEILRERKPLRPVADRPRGDADQGGREGQPAESNQPVERVRGGLDSRPEDVLGEQGGDDTRDGRGSAGGRGSDRELGGHPDQRVGREGRPSPVPAQQGGSGRPAGASGRGGGRVRGGREGLLDAQLHPDGGTGNGSRPVLKEGSQRQLDTEKLPYRPHNSAFSLESVAPAAMVEAMDRTLSRIEREHGDIDEFVRKELGYGTVDELHQALAAEQVDSVAMAIYQMKQGQALIIGDQTGVGKGRQMAALIRWAVRQGEKPIFITQKADLFSDIYRDLVDIGSGDLVPFIFNDPSGNENRGEMVDANGKVVYKGLTKSRMQKVLATGKLPDGYDYAVLTYSQVNTGDEISRKEAAEAAKKSGKRVKKSKDDGRITPKAPFLRSISKGNYLFLDESHTAAGEGKTGSFMQSILRDVKAATFASATFAKRPDTMPLYAIRTSMSQAKVDPDKLISIIEKGGVTLQEIMSRELTNAGQMVRRERDMSDVVTDWETIDDPVTTRRARDNYDRTIAAFNAIIKFQEDYVKPMVEAMDKELAVMAESAGIKRGTNKMGVDNVPFASKTYNYTKQLMLALKADAIADKADSEIKSGRHPVIALESTMESSIDEYAAGEVVAEPTFGTNLLKGLDSVMQYTIKDENGKEQHARYSPKQLGEAGEKAYYELQDFIRESTSDVFISPIDAIIGRLHEMGYKVGELTGRDKYVELDNEGRAVVRKRTDKDKKRMQREFNNGELDVLILNKSASTGISLHASEKFKDQRQRTMIVAQPLSDINDYMQMIGRIDRTGQVHRGYYINLGLPVPAENRFLMMLSTKLKSLNANTTTSQESESNEVEAPDLLNKYGSQVVVEYLRDNPDIYEKMGSPLKKGGDKGGTVSLSELDEYKPQEEDALKITGRVALLATQDQEEFYDDVVRRYNELIKYLNDTGNNDLKITVMPLRAKTLTRRVSSEGIDPTGDNPFAQNSYVERVEMDVLRKPMKASEVRKTIEQVNKGQRPEDYIRQVVSTIDKEDEARIAAEEARYERAKLKAQEDIAKQAEKINRQQKRTAEEKQAAIADYAKEANENVEAKHGDNMARLNTNSDMLKRRLRMFEVGKPYLVPDNLEVLTFDFSTPAIFCGYKAKDSKITASTTLAVFATLDGRRRVEIKLSQLGALQSIHRQTQDNYDVAQSTTLDNWDSQIPTGTRKTGFIMTGNILQAIADTQDERGGFPGQLISYTDIDGNVHDGILMPDKWNTSMLKTSGAPIISRLQQIRDYMPVTSHDGKVQILGSSWTKTYYLTVPKTKKDGAVYYENKTLLRAVNGGNFYPYRGKLRADIPAENIETVVRELSKLGVKVKEEVNNDDDVLYRADDFTTNEEEANDLFRVVDDASEIERLNNEPTIKVYRAMSLVDGKLYPPMSKKIGTGSNRISQAPSEFGQWEVSDERPELVEKEGKNKNHIYIVKDNGKGLWVAYNPYFHTSRNPLNDQFAEAYQRPNLVTVEVEVPASELTSGYQAEGAKDPVGETKWNAGPVNRQLSGDKKRKVILSRWMRPVRIVPESEVAQRIADLIEGENVAIPDNTITPSLLEELKKLGVKIVDGINKSRKKASTVLRSGNGTLTDDDLSIANDPVSKLLGKSTRTARQRKAFAERERGRMVERVRELAETLHLDNVDIVTDASTLQGNRTKAKGFYSRSTGRITIVIPNQTSVFDAEQTLLHEAVAHYGLRELFGEHFDTFLDNVFQNADTEVRRHIVELAERRGWDFRTATEEYLASLAENTNFENVNASWWSKIKELFLRMLHKIGFEDFSGVTLSDNELRYILWRSYENLAEPGRYRSILGEAADVAKQHELKVGNYAVVSSEGRNVADNDLYRDGAPEVHERVYARRRYEERVKRGMYQMQEALQDSMLGLREAMNAILRGEGKKKVNIEDVDGFENAYLGENRLSSVNKAEADAFAHLLFKPLLDEVAKLAPNEDARITLTDYMMAKHGLERNRVMAERDAQKDYEATQQAHPHSKKTLQDFIDEYRQKDYAGLTALTGTDNVADAEAEAQILVNDYEAAHDTAALWKRTKDVSNAILSKLYETGMMSKETYDNVRSMYDYYIPLRGFDEKTSEEAYAYLNSKNSAFNAPVKTAKGRKSKADDPFAYLQSMAESAIMQGNRNKLVKQRFLNFVLNHPSDLASVSDLWLKYDETVDEWKPIFPDNINENDTAEEVERKMQAFEERMKKLAEQNPDRYKHGKETVNILYRVVEKRDLRQHQVVVKRGGRDYVITINGNPRAAQALNGQTNPDNDMSGAIGAILRAGERINRELSALYTTRNPDFVVSNFIRDMLYSNSMAWIKESPNYALRYHRNFAKVNPVRMKMLLAKYRNGTLDMNNGTERMFHQFMMNGGETGYANIRDIERHKNDIRREIRKSNGRIPIRKAWDWLSERFDEFNRGVENCARFAAFMTSREMGRTIDRSIYDAKEISVNFNKKGSGAKFMGTTGQTGLGNTSAFLSGLGRSGFVFWNAAIQGTANFGRQTQRHPAKALTGLAVMFLLGAVVASLGYGDDDEDDKNSYWNLPEYVRRSNLLFRAGDQWISIPLPVEYRAVYGLGELMTSTLSGKEHFTDGELAGKIAGQVSQLLPLDFLEGGGGFKALIPSSIKPFAEAYGYEKSWTGLPLYKDTPFNKEMPEWTKAYKSANKYLVDLSETLNEISGGDKYTKGAIDFNPSKLEYVLEGYFGGVANTINRLVKMGETVVGEREYEPQSFLILNRILKNGDERTEYKAVNNEYFRLKEEHDKLRTRLRNYEHDTVNGIFDYAEKIDFLYNSPEYRRYEIFEKYRPSIDALYDFLKEANANGDQEAVKDIEAQLNEAKKEMVKEMEETRK